MKNRGVLFFAAFLKLSRYSQPPQWTYLKDRRFLKTTMSETSFSFAYEFEALRIYRHFHIIKL